MLTLELNISIKYCHHIPIIFLCAWLNLFNLFVSVATIVFVVFVSCLFPGSTFLLALSIQHIWPSLLVCGWVKG